MREPSRLERAKACWPALAIALAFAACATPQSPAPVRPVAPPESYRRAEADRVKGLEFELERLRADLRVAEETLLAVESGMRGTQRRAEAVSALAEARIEVDRAAQRAPWRSDVAAEARDKLAEADRQLAAGHIGSAIFFVSRASRIAAALAAEADRVASDSNVHWVRGERVNLRAAPSRAAEVLAVLSPEHPLFVESSKGGWSLVRTLSGRIGFVRSDLLRRP